MKRVLKIVGGILAVLLITLASYVTWFYYSWNFRYPEEMKQRLATSRDLKRDVRPYGVVLELNGGEWIAIAYRDIHSPNLMSRSIALTSSGKWLASSTHFCAGLVGYGAQRDFWRHSGAFGAFNEADFAKHCQGDEYMSVLFDAERSPTIENSINLLKKIGFVEIEGPAVVKK